MPADPAHPELRVLGFVSYPAGNLLLDSDSIAYDSQGGGFSTLARPSLPGQDSAAYDWAARRWLPTRRALISPDGTRYLYQDPRGTGIRIVDVPSGISKLVLPQANVDPLSLESDGVVAVALLAHGAALESGPATLQFVDANTRVTRALFSGPVAWKVVAGKSAFGTDLNPSDPSPLIQSPGEPARSAAHNRVWQIDLAGGSPVQWMYVPGALVEVAGVDGAGRLIVVVVRIDRTEVWALTGRDSGTIIFRGPGSSRTDPLGLNSFGLVDTGIADANGFWLGTTAGVLLFTPATGFKLVYSGRAIPAGGCH